MGLLSLDQAGATSLICFPQSGHLIKGMIAANSIV